jgi:hypothetical protein
MHRAKFMPRNGTGTIVIAPTRELALQVCPLLCGLYTCIIYHCMCFAVFSVVLYVMLLYLCVVCTLQRYCMYTSAKGMARNSRGSMERGRLKVLLQLRQACMLREAAPYFARRHVIRSCEPTVSCSCCPSAMCHFVHIKSCRSTLLRVTFMKGHSQRPTSARELGLCRHTFNTPASTILSLLLVTVTFCRSTV